MALHICGGILRCLPKTRHFSQSIRSCGACVCGYNTDILAGTVGAHTGRPYITLSRLRLIAGSRAALMDNSQDTSADQFLEKAGMLIEALPFMRRYSDKTLVVKFGGHAMGEPEYVSAFASDIALLDQVGARPVVVHGGGPQIGEMLEKLQIESNFIDGLRVTDEATISVVEMVLAGGINKALVAAITMAGARAAGISGKDGGLIMARKLLAQAKSAGNAMEKVVDLGFVGEPSKINTEVLDALGEKNLIPVVAPVVVVRMG